jgi:hypothetical protein
LALLRSVGGRAVGIGLGLAANPTPDSLWLKAGIAADVVGRGRRSCRGRHIPRKNALIGFGGGIAYALLVCLIALQKPRNVLGLDQTDRVAVHDRCHDVVVKVETDAGQIDRDGDADIPKVLPGPTPDNISSRAEPIAPADSTSPPEHATAIQSETVNEPRTPTTSISNARSYRISDPSELRRRRPQTPLRCCIV